jgi:hypothetical protein
LRVAAAAADERVISFSLSGTCKKVGGGGKKTKKKEELYIPPPAAEAKKGDMTQLRQRQVGFIHSRDFPPSTGEYSLSLSPVAG